MTPEIITHTEVSYKWLWCESAATPAVIITITLAITLSIVIKFFIWSRKKKCKECSKKIK